MKFAIAAVVAIALITNPASAARLSRNQEAEDLPTPFSRKLDDKKEEEVSFCSQRCEQYPM